MNTLIIKLNAAGDVVRTTTLLRWLPGEITWITAKENLELLAGAHGRVRPLAWEDRDQARDRAYELTINLEDELTTALFAETVIRHRAFGARVDQAGNLTYCDESSVWFAMSLISVYGRVRADELKLRNRRTYQDLIFSGLGRLFAGEPYLLPPPLRTDLCGDVAIAPVAGPVWPMKGWAFYDELKRTLESSGYVVNILPRRPTMREHLGDIANHRCLVGGDSLPMHLALGVQVPCVTLFSCTSPWEIHDYGIQTKIISPLLERYFYKRGYDPDATRAIRLDDVFNAVLRRLTIDVTDPTRSPRKSDSQQAFGHRAPG